MESQEKGLIFPRPLEDESHESRAIIETQLWMWEDMEAELEEVLFQ